MEALKRSLGLSSEGPSASVSSQRRELEIDQNFRRLTTTSNQVSNQRRMTPTSTQNSVETADDERNSTKVKSKLLSMWNNVKYGKTLFSLDPTASNFTSHSAVWLLGLFYDRKFYQYLDPECPAQLSQQVFLRLN
jgi:hypothetical protein